MPRAGARADRPIPLLVQAGEQGAHMGIVHREEDGVLAREIVVERRLAEANLIRQHLHRRFVISHPVEQRRAMSQYLVALFVMRLGRLPFLCCLSRHCRPCSLSASYLSQR